MIWLLNVSSSYCGTEPGFKSLSSGKRSFVSCAGYRVYQKRLADRNVSLVLMASTRSGTGYFYFH